MRTTIPISLSALALALVLAWPHAARASVRLAVSPETLSVAPGATFTLDLRVLVPGTPFNGYDAVVEYDPAVLTFLPTSPTSLQQGQDMTGACGNTFHIFKAAGDSLTINHSLLCANLSLTGPAHLYTLRFRAPLTPGVTQVRPRRVQFYEAGYYVNPAITSPASVSWGVTLAVGYPPVSSGPRIAVRSNPARGEQWFDLTSPREGEQRLIVYDTAGRVVRHLAEGRHAAGSRTVRWDGRDDGGRAVPPGLYVVRFDAAGAAARASIVRLP